MLHHGNKSIPLFLHVYPLCSSSSQAFVCIRKTWCSLLKCRFLLISFPDSDLVGPGQELRICNFVMPCRYFWYLCLLHLLKKKSIAVAQPTSRLFIFAALAINTLLVSFRTLVISCLCISLYLLTVRLDLDWNTKNRIKCWSLWPWHTRNGLPR